MDTIRLTDSLYKSIDVWKICPGRFAIRYRCFEIVDKNRYCVQSADYFNYPIDRDQIARFDKQFLELLIECIPDERTETYSSLEEAIRRHEEEFKDMEKGG